VLLLSQLPLLVDTDVNRRMYDGDAAADVPTIYPGVLCTRFLSHDRKGSGLGPLVTVRVRASELSC